MFKWLFRLIFVGILGLGGYAAYDYYEADFHTMPPHPENSFPLSFTFGIKAIVIDQGPEDKNRRYLGASFKVPHWMEETWSFCYAPTEKEDKAVRKAEHADLNHARLDAFSTVDVDGKKIPRGAVYSVPK
jgi:hypothetical protein